jgi:hypothetical protein
MVRPSKWRDAGIVVIADAKANRANTDARNVPGVSI